MTIERTQSGAWKKLVAAGLVGMGAASSLAQSAGFWLVGYPTGGKSSRVNSLSQDGLIAGGTSDVVSKSPGFRWTAKGGRDDWGLLPGMPEVTAVYAMDSTGAVLAGDMFLAGVGFRPFRRVGDGSLENLGVLPTASRSFANGVSGDGSIVVGYGETGPNSYQYGEAFRWTQAGGMKGIGHLTPGSFLSDARGISRDGSTVVGYNQNEVGWGQGFTWTEAGGMKALPGLPGAPLGNSARAVNADGTVIVGSSTSTNDMSHAVRWTPTGIEDLVSPAYVGKHSTSLAVADDGNVVGGRINNTAAFIWSEATGFMLASDYFASHGVGVPPNYKLEYVYAVSGDGRTFGGYALNTSTKKIEGFVATVPGGACTADCDASGGLDIDDFICFQTRFAIADPYADCDASGGLDIDDFICFQTLFAVGCQG